MWELDGRVSIGSSPTGKAEMLAQREGERWARRGYDVQMHNLPCPVQGGWAVKESRCRWGIFWEDRETKCKRYCFDRQGIQIPEIPEDELFTNCRGTVERKTLSEELWADETARESLFGLRLHRPKVSVEGEKEQKQALTQVLKRAGCRVEERWRPGICSFWLERGGFSLMARDERGAVVDSGQLLGVVTLIEMENGGRKVALPPRCGVAPRLVAAGHGGQVLEWGESGWHELYANLPWMRDGVSAAVRICARMAASGQSLEKLVSATPRFQQWKRECRTQWDHDRVLAQLNTGGKARMDGQGIQLHVGQSWVHIGPARDGRIQLLAEGPDMEAAEELCDLCVRRLTQEER